MSSWSFSIIYGALLPWQNRGCEPQTGACSAGETQRHAPAEQITSLMPAAFVKRRLYQTPRPSPLCPLPQL